MCPMADPSKYSEAELELIGLIADEVNRIRTEQKTRELTLREMEMLLLIARTNNELRATHEG